MFLFTINPRISADDHGMPRKPVRLLFAAALCTTLGAAGTLQSERIGARPDADDVLHKLELDDESFRELSAQQIAGAFRESPPHIPLLLRRALVTGHGSAALDALDQLPAALRADFRGWSDLIDAERAPLGSRSFLFDRSGRPLAQVDSGGSTQLAAAADEQVLPGALLPQEIVRAAESSPGTALRTTLDLELSRSLQKVLNRSTARLRSRAADGTVVVLGANSAELLAAVAARTRRNRWGHVLQPDEREIAAARSGHDHLTQRREPASIAKLITTAAAYRAGRDADAEIDSMSCNGSLKLGSEILYCTSIKRGLRGLDHAMASSCNIAFAELGRRIGFDRVVDEYRRFGFAVGEPGHELLGSVPVPTLRERDYGDLSIGLNHVEITPLHAALLARTMVDGRWLTPRIWQGRTGATGRSLRPLQDPNVRDPLRGLALAGRDFPDHGQQLLPPGALGPLQDSMAAVVRFGTASTVQPRGLTVRMKTGTGQTAGEGFHINYIGWTGEPGKIEPSDVAFAIRLTGGRSSRLVRREARALTREVLRVLGDWQNSRGTLEAFRTAAGNT